MFPEEVLLADGDAGLDLNLVVDMLNVIVLVAHDAHALAHREIHVHAEETKRRLGKDTSFGGDVRHCCCTTRTKKGGLRASLPLCWFVPRELRTTKYFRSKQKRLKENTLI